MIDLIYWLFKIIKFVNDRFYRTRYASICGGKSCTRCGRRPFQSEIRLALLFYHFFDYKAAKESRVWNANPNNGYGKYWNFTDLTQFGTILHIPGINSRPLTRVNIDKEDFYQRKFMEMESSLVWREVENLNGSWKIAKIIDQGKCAENFDGPLVASLAEFVPANPLFSASFSKLTVDLSKIGSKEIELIAPHFGSTTAKSRVHIPIDVDKEIVNNVEICTTNFRAPFTTMRWHSAFELDDSYEHKVRFTPTSDLPKKGVFSRTVLIFDRWQAHLTHVERAEINFVAEKLL